MNPYAKRIAAVRDELCESNRDFARRIGKTPQHTSALCLGKTTAATSTLELILAAFPQVSRSWLYFGEGAMLTDYRRAAAPGDLLRDIADTLSHLAVKLNQYASLCSTSAS